MKLFKSITISLMFLLSLGAYAFAGMEKLSPQKYEVKSEILNFNYEEMAYPTKGINIGVQSETYVPAVRKPGKQLTEEEIMAMKADTVKNAVGTIIIFIIIVLSTMGAFIIIPFIGHCIMFIIESKKKIDKETKKTL